MRNLIKFAKARAGQALEGIYRGKSAAVPYKGELDSCKWCAYKDQCGYDALSHYTRRAYPVSKKKLLEEASHDQEPES